VDSCASLSDGASDVSSCGSTIRHVDEDISGLNSHSDDGVHGDWQDRVRRCQSKRARSWLPDE
jgi:hypothetical protein